MLMSHHPGFLCPLCRTFADLEATVEIDDPVEEQAAVQSKYFSSLPTTSDRDHVFFLFSNMSCPTNAKCRHCF